MGARTRPAIDWTPGGAAIEALQIAQTLLPHLNRQALIDRLVITGLHALRHPALPQFWGSDRDAWKLPANLRTPGTTEAAPQAGGNRFPGAA